MFHGINTRMHVFERQSNEQVFNPFLYIEIVEVQVIILFTSEFGLHLEVPDHIKHCHGNYSRAILPDLTAQVHTVQYCCSLEIVWVCMNVTLLEVHNDLWTMRIDDSSVLLVKLCHEQIQKVVWRRNLHVVLDMCEYLTLSLVDLWFRQPKVGINDAVGCLRGLLLLSCDTETSDPNLLQILLLNLLVAV